MGFKTSEFQANNLEQGYQSPGLFNVVILPPMTESDSADCKVCLVFLIKFLVLMVEKIIFLTGTCVGLH